MERSSGGTVSLLMKGSVPLGRMGTIAETSQSISADYEILVNLYNCLCTVLCDFDILLPFSSNDTWIEDEQNIIHIGLWQYHRDEGTRSTSTPTALSKHDRRKILEDLEVCAWLTPYDTDHALYSSVPRWLSISRNAAMQSHGVCKELTELSRPNFTDNETIVQCKNKLKRGHITGPEFIIFMEREKQHGSEMRPTVNDDEDEPDDDRKSRLVDSFKNVTLSLASKIKSKFTSKSHGKLVSDLETDSCGSVDEKTDDTYLTDEEAKSDRDRSKSPR